jgi:hypothetical protein
MQQRKQSIHLIMAPNIIGTQLILNVGLQLNVSTMVPLSAQPRKTLGEWHSQPISQTTTSLLILKIHQCSQGHPYPYILF